MMPEAPVRFSTMKFCLSESPSFAPSMRASGSTEPPGGYGETNLTGFVGQSWAAQTDEKAATLSAVKSLKSDIPCSFQFEHLARVVRRGDREAEVFEHALRLRDLLGVRFGELPAADPKTVLKPDTHVAAHHRGLRGDLHLRASGAEHRPVIGIAKKAIGGALHVDDILGMVADAAADAEHRLDEKRRLDEPAVDEVRRGVKVPDVVALDLEARAVRAAGLEDVGDVLEGVFEDAIVGASEVGLLPVVLEVFVAPEHLVQTEVHRAHVERGHFRLELQRRLQALFHAHRCR